MVKFVRAALLPFSLLVLVGCFDLSENRTGLAADPGFTAPCFEALDALRDARGLPLGACRQGLVLNYEDEAGVLQSTCFGQVLPAVEICNFVDDDCDGQIDEGTTCAAEASDELERQVGTVNQLVLPGRSGPAVMARPWLGTLFPCLEGETAPACADRFLAKHGAVWGIASPVEADAVAPEDGTPPSPGWWLERRDPPVVSSDAAAQAVWYTQVYGVRGAEAPPVPVEGRWIALSWVSTPDPRAISLVAVRARLTRIDERLPVAAALPPESVVDALPPGTELLSAPVLVFRDLTTEGSLAEDAAPAGEEPAPVLRLAYRVDVRGPDAAAQRTWIDAETGEVLAAVLLHPAHFFLESPGDDEPPAALDAHTVLSDWTEFLVGTERVDIQHGAGPTHLDTAIHFRVADGSVTTECRGEEAYFDVDEGTIHLCADRGETAGHLVHEAGHQLLLRYWSGARYAGELRSRDHDAVVEALAESLAQLSFCAAQSGTCAILDGGRHPYATLTRRRDRVGQARDAAADAAVPGSAIARFFDLLAAHRGLAAPDAATVTGAIVVSALKDLAGAAPANGAEAFLEFEDLAAVLDDACRSLQYAGASVRLGSPTPQGTGRYAIRKEDCDLLTSGFRGVEVDVVHPTDGFPELCNGMADSNERLVDQVYTADFHIVPVSEPCPHDGDYVRATLPDEVGVCRNGVRECHDGVWGPCEGAVDRAHERCDSFDNDCDGRTDESPFPVPYRPELRDPTETTGQSGGLGPNPDPLRYETYAPDEDGDGHWSDRLATRVVACSLPAAHFLDVEAWPDARDCDDGDAAVYAGATERCGDRIDSDCDGTASNGCGCDPLNDAPVSCAPFEAFRESGESCRMGLQSCEVRLDGTWALSDCVGASTGGPEVCDGEDNDCDGATDEEVTGLADACGFLDTGGEVCRDGEVVCVGGDWPDCPGTTTPGPEVCDDEDNDCDGTTDEDVTGLADACGYEGTGREVCRSGIVFCEGGQWPDEICTDVAVGATTSWKIYTDEALNGDGDFDNDPPGKCVAITLSTTVRLVGAQTVSADIYMRATESGGDNSRWQGRGDFVLATAGAGCRIALLDVGGSRASSHSFNDCDHEIDYAVETVGPVQLWEVYGDHGGTDAPYYTGVVVHFDPFSMNVCCQ